MLMSFLRKMFSWHPNFVHYFWLILNYVFLFISFCREDVPLLLAERKIMMVNAKSHQGEVILVHESDPSCFKALEAKRRKLPHRGSHQGHPFFYLHATSILESTKSPLKKRNTVDHGKRLIDVNNVTSIDFEVNSFMGGCTGGSLISGKWIMFLVYFISVFMSVCIILVVFYAFFILFSYFKVIRRY